MKLFQILRGRDNGIDKITINFHNPLWIIFGFAIGYYMGYGVGKYSHYVEKFIGG